jgi:hypothetical protein
MYSVAGDEILHYLPSDERLQLGQADKISMEVLTGVQDQLD